MKLTRYKVFCKLSSLLTVLLLSSVSVQAQQDNSLFRQAHRRQVVLQGRGAYTGPQQAESPIAAALPSDEEGVTSDHIGVLEASWITVNIPQPKDFKVHDLVEIVVNEVSKHTVKADNKLERDNQIDAKLEDWIKFGDGFTLGPSQQSDGDPTIAGGIQRQFEGKGEAKREDTLSARIMAEIVDILPNGNLVLEATKTVVTDEDETVLTLTGVCRGNDVGPGNSLVSTKLAKLEVTKTSSGAAYDATKRGFLHKLLDTFNPF